MSCVRIELHPMPDWDVLRGPATWHCLRRAVIPVVLEREIKIHAMIPATSVATTQEARLVWMGILITGRVTPGLKGRQI